MSWLTKPGRRRELSLPKQTGSRLAPRAILGRLLGSYETNAAPAGLAICLIGISASVYRASTRLVENARWVAHTHDVLTQLEAIAAGLGDAETELRGFLLTNQEAYLAPYRDGLTKTRRRIDSGLRSRARIRRAA
ncbi:MAG TPA: CHASE3 domain-containing protein [Bryobacteraceae bacterium]|nr:CHASE3 domain-containing protein [Bryobacteraceae bacterium]